MRWWRILGIASVSTLLGCGASATPVNAQATASRGGEGCGCMQKGGMHDGGKGTHGKGCMGMHGNESAHGLGTNGDTEGVARMDDRAVFHELLDHRDAIQREVTRLPDGVVTVTESDDPAIAEKIRQHAEAMHQRLLEKRPIHRRDPLFAATFAQAKKIKMTIEPTPRGVRVVETSTDPQVVELIQMHADVVSAFLKYGHEEVRKNHPVPRP